MKDALALSLQDDSSEHPLERRFAGLRPHLEPGTAFDLVLPDRPALRIGDGRILFRLVVKDSKGVAALSSLDEMRVGEAYLDGHFNIEGDLVAALDLRTSLTDNHALVKLWAKHIRPKILGQVKCDRQWIQEHYDSDPEFYLLFLDKDWRCYSHGYFADEEESLEGAIRNKLEAAYRLSGITAGARVLDIGAGWGAFTQFAAQRGAHVTSLTISQRSREFVSDLIWRKSLNAQVLLEHFLEHRPETPYDAIVNLGVTEHLPDYRASLEQYCKLLKPGGRVFLDACAAERKYPFGAFTQAHVWPGNATPLVLREYLDEMSRTPFELLSIVNDRRNYLLTCRHWAENLDRNKDVVIARWGERLYRRFHLYLWGCVHEFTRHSTTAYRMVFQKRADS